MVRQRPFLPLSKGQIFGNATLCLSLLTGILARFPANLLINIPTSALFVEGLKGYQVLLQRVPVDTTP